MRKRGLNREYKNKDQAADKSRLSYVLFSSFPIFSFLILVSSFFVLFSVIFSGTVSASSLLKAPNNLGLVGYWSFDDATGTKATDSSGSGITGTLTNGPLWVSGKFKNGVQFDAFDDYVDTGNTSLLNGLSTLTISVWVKPTNTSTTQRSIISNYDNTSTNGGVLLERGTLSNNILFAVNAGANPFGYTVASTLNTGQWNHVLATFDGTQADNASRMKIYINGVSQSLTFSGTIPASTGTTTNTAKIGASLDALDTRYFDGGIDDVRVYNRALTAAEASALYNTTARISRTKTITTQGLVGYWSFDDATGTLATDSSGNGNTGTLTNMEAADWISGKRGKALDFDGTNDYAKIGSSLGISGSANLTIAFWVKPTNVSSGGMVAGLVNSNPNIAVFVGPLGAAGGSGSVSVEYQSCGEYTPNSVVSNGIWQHVAVVKTAGTVHANTIIYVNGVAQSHTNEFSDCNPTFGGSNTFNIGSGWNSDSDYPFAGAVDEVRIYNRALSATEVAALYNARSARTNASQAGRNADGLVGYWSFNGGDVYSTAAYDRSGQGNTGTLTNGPVPGIGKIGQALTFDASNDFISIGTPSILAFTDTQSFTIGAWMQPSIITNRRGIFSKVSSATKYIALENNAANPRFIMASGGGSTSVTASASVDTSNWYHVVAVRDVGTDTVEIYVNGVSSGSAADNTTGSAWNDSGNWRIGDNENGFTSYYGGLLDEIRVYNRALTAAEVLRLYVNGK